VEKESEGHNDSRKGAPSEKDDEKRREGGEGPEV